MNRILTIATALAACAAISPVADAQLVRIGPFGGVSVRAPFVSVDTLPFGGGARVRAPFTSVDTRLFARPYYGYRYGNAYPVAPVYPAPVYTTPAYPQPAYPQPAYPQPAYPQPAYPQPAYPQTTNPQAASPQSGDYQSARPSVAPEDLPRRLRGSAQQLKRSLSLRRNDSDVWLDYLDPDRIIATLDQGGSPTALRDLVRNYDGIVGNGSLGSIRAAAGFSETRRLLRQLVDSPEAPRTIDRQPVQPAQADSEPVPAPGGPTPATPVKPAEAGGAKTPEALPLPPQPTPTPL
jgi:hypothetical protein